MEKKDYAGVAMHLIDNINDHCNDGEISNSEAVTLITSVINDLELN